MGSFTSGSLRRSKSRYPDPPIANPPRLLSRLRLEEADERALVRRESGGAGASRAAERRELSALSVRLDDDGADVGVALRTDRLTSLPFFPRKWKSTTSPSTETWRFVSVVTPVRL
jgi:hypothetical protein